MRLPDIGDPFAHHYRILQVLGSGGFATVFGAADLRDGRHVALKILKPDQTSTYSPETEARFDREMRILGQIESPYIVEKLEEGRTSEGLLYAVFEWLPGRDLNELRDARGVLQADDVTSIMQQLLRALESAHGRALLHRDIKPQNVRVVSEDGGRIVVKLMDFGLARSHDPDRTSITRTGSLVGTPRYMSPEQLHGRELTPASDIYSLGLMAFELLMGKEALAGNSLFDQIERMASGHRLTAPEFERIDAHLVSVIHRMTVKDPNKRYQSAAEALAALDRRDVEAITLVKSRSSARPRATAAALGGAVVVAAVVVASTWPSSETPTVMPTATLRPTAAERPDDTGPAHSEADAEVDAGPTPLSPGAPSEGCARQQPFEAAKLTSPTEAALDYDPTTPHPLIVLLADKDDVNDFGLSPAAVGRKFIRDSGFGALVEDVPMVVMAVPDRSKGWQKIEDVNYARDHVEVAMKELCIDTSRVFVVSHDTGGRLNVPLACKPWVSGVAIHGSTFRAPYFEEGRWCANPKPAIWLAPQKSPKVPIDGKSACDERIHMTLEATEELWRERNGCDDRRTEWYSEDGSTCFEWQCDEPFVSCHLNGGLSWPGTESRVNPRCPDPPAARFDIAKQIWRFFSEIDVSAEAVPPPPAPGPF